MLSTTLGPTGSMSGSSSASRGLRLLVRDDGVGLPAVVAADGMAKGSLGLPGMAERTRLIGGTFAIHSGERAGTTVDVWVPESIPGRDLTAPPGHCHRAWLGLWRGALELSSDRNAYAVSGSSAGGTILPWPPS